jgi:hypothetical protein
LAPGGGGLTPAYAIDREVLLTYIPEVDAPPLETGDTRGEPKGEPLPQKGEPKGAPVHTSSLSCYLPPKLSDAGSADGRVSPAALHEADNVQATNVDVVVEERVNFSPSATAETAGQRRGQVKPCGEKVEPQQDGINKFVEKAEQAQRDRHLTPAQVCQEFKFVFDRLLRQRQERDRYLSTRLIGEPGHRVANPVFDEDVLDAMPKGIDLEWKRPLPKHQKVAAEYFRAVGRDVALAQWEKFLLDGVHEVSQPRRDDEGKLIGVYIEQQDWLLYIFVNEQTAGGINPGARSSVENYSRFDVST